jgi:hypothetical protein
LVNLVLAWFESEKHVQIRFHFGGKGKSKTRFDETQRPLTEDIRGAKVLIKKGARWLSADELARFGVEQVMKKCSL